MLTIKKRFPWRRLYFYGSGALIVGFAGIMTFLVQTNSNLDQFVSRAPAQIAPAQKTETSTNTTAEDNTETSSQDSDVASDSNTTSSWNGIAQPTQNTSEPSNPEPTASSEDANPAPVQPTEPTQPTTPTEPEVPVETTPEEPGVIDEIVDSIIVPTP